MSLQPFALPERYRLEGGIAAGGMAAVYAAHDTVLDRPVAVKVLADHLNGDATARKRFEREARLAAAVSNHAGVVTIFDVGEFNGRAFIVMERREGGTIGDAGRVDQARALEWLGTIADAVDAAHERGVVHRDLKPANLLLDQRGAVAVADFGIASLMDDTERFTQTGQVLGTAAYLSPEQACGESATPASDRYSLAVVAFELLTGAKPFDTGSFAAQARAHIETPPPDAPGLPRRAQDVLKRGMAKAPGDRWPSAHAFVQALGDALTQTAPRPGPAAEPTRAMPAQPPARPPRRAAAPAPPASGGRRTGAILAVAALVLVLVAAGAIALQGDDTAGRAGNGNGNAKRKAQTPATAAAAPEETAAPAQTAAPTAEPTATAKVGAGDAAALNAEGFDSFRAEDYDAAIPPLEQAVAACGGGGTLDPCGFALFNLGASYNRAGRSDEAIAVLEQRLKQFGDNEGGDVQAELDDAVENASR